MTLASSSRPLADGTDLVLLDLDGVVYIGPDAVPGAVEALDAVRGLDHAPKLAYVTNNAFRTPDTVVAHLRDLGLAVEDGDVVTSAQAAAAMLAEQVPAGTKTLVVGGPGVRQALLEAGLTPVDSADDDPQAVVQGFNPDVGWRLLAEGTRAVRGGAVWIATNTDLTIPTPHGPGPGNGTLVQVIRTASGQEPQVAGKPQPPLFHQAAARFGAKQPLVVGDRLDTDIEGANNADMPSLLVLTGVTGAAELLAAPENQRPTYLSEDLGGLLTEHAAPEPDGDAWTCADAVVRLEGAKLTVVTRGDDATDLLRAACAAVWGGESDDVDPSDLLTALGEVGGTGVWARYRDV